MKISQKLENACRVMVQLASNHDGKSVTRVEDLAKKEHLSANFLLQILNDLRRAGVVESRRGKFGGYKLERRAEEITLKQIIEAIEGSALDVEAAEAGESAMCVAKTWAEVTRRFEAMLAGISLADMMAQDKEGGGLFYI